MRRTALHSIALCLVASHYVGSHRITLCYVTLHHTEFHHIGSCCIGLHFYTAKFNTKKVFIILIVVSYSHKNRMMKSAYAEYFIHVWRFRIGLKTINICPSFSQSVFFIELHAEHTKLHTICVKKCVQTKSIRIENT